MLRSGCVLDDALLTASLALGKRGALVPVTGELKPEMYGAFLNQRPVLSAQTQKALDSGN